MDKLIEKHNTIYICEGLGITKDDCIQSHANITKEVACGFAEWCEIEEYQYFQDDLWSNFETSDNMFTTSELFDLYIKSL